jgi:hypothetical protein
MLTIISGNQEQSRRLTASNERHKYGTASATGDRGQDNAADTQIARLRCGHDRWQQKRNDLSEHPTSDQTGKSVTNRAEIKVRRCPTCGDSTKRSRNKVGQNLFHLDLPVKPALLVSRLPTLSTLLEGSAVSIGIRTNVVHLCTYAQLFLRKKALRGISHQPSAASAAMSGARSLKKRRDYCREIFIGECADIKPSSKDCGVTR